MKFKQKENKVFLYIYNSRNSLWSSNFNLVFRNKLSTTVEILYEVQTKSERMLLLKSTTVEILYEVQTKSCDIGPRIYNSRNSLWSSNNSLRRITSKSTTVEILYEVQTLQQDAYQKIYNSRNSLWSSNTKDSRRGNLYLQQ